MAYRKVSDDSLSAVANAIRAKSGTSANLVFPDEFVSAISGLSGDDAFVSDAAFDYEINPINGVTYGFALNSAGFYESTNQKRSSSYSICRVKLTVKRTCDITFDVINYAENRCDYGIFGNLDASLSLSASADTANVYKSYSSEHSADAVQLTYNAVAPGDHFIDVKYIKDSSQDSNNDSLQFKIRQVGGLPQETIDKILAADPDLKAENIKAGVDIFGVVGTHEGASAPELQSKTVTPSATSQTVTPDAGYGGLSSVVINGDADLIPDNIKSGVNIFGVDGTLSAGSSFDLKGFIEKTISTLILPDDLTKIGAYSLYRLEQLQGISIPAGVTEIGAYALYGCTALTMVSFSGTPATIAVSAFSTCNNLAHIYVPWAEGAVSGAPWGATRATIHYDT